MTNHNLVNLTRLAKELELSRPAARRLFASVPAVKRGRKTLVRREDLLDYLKCISSDVKQFADVILSGN